MPTSTELLAAGIKPGELFGRCLKCATLDEALLLWNARDQSRGQSKVSGAKMKPGSAWEWLSLHPLLDLPSREFPGKKASRSEKRRWLENRAVLVNGEARGPDEPIDFPVTGLVFFPSSSLRVTML